MAYQDTPSAPGSDDLYGDGAAAEPKPEPTPEESDGGETALLPSSICPGMKPGDELRMKVVRVHDDQYEVAYEKGEGKEEAAEAPMPQGDSEMASMMED